MRSLTELVDAINDLKYDIKAEVIIADLLESGVNPADIFIQYDSTFKRRYTNDVAEAHVKELNNRQDILLVHVTRDGLYDSLPEGLFHEQSAKPVTSGQEMAKESKKQKIEEKEARTFFMPFENELFYQNIKLELEERQILQRYGENLFDDIYPEFWNLDRSLPQKYISRLVLLLHFVYRIVGNMEMTAKALEIITEEKVKINVLPSEQIGLSNGLDHGSKPFALGEGSLGKDFVCGDSGVEDFPKVEFVFGPLRNTSIIDYLGNGKMTRFLEVFCSYFIPMEMDWTKRVTVCKSKERFAMDPEQPSFMGFNTVI